MDQVNINRRSSPPPGRPPRRPSWWPVLVLLIILIIIGIVFAARQVTQHNSASPTATVTVAPSATVAAAPTSTAQEAAATVGTPSLVPGAATSTSGGGATSTPQPPTNPTALHVVSGSCAQHQITWSWTGAQRATSYEVVIYNPVSGATIKYTTTTTASYTLPAGPGATAALKVRSRNAAGTGQGYFTPGSVGHVPPQTTNPTHMTVDVTDHTLTWFWGGATHATVYDFVLYHYAGAGTAKTDIKGRANQPHWAITVTPGTTYYLKVQSVGQCAPSSYYSPPVSARA